MSEHAEHALTLFERDKLARLEALIEDGMGAFVRVGLSLLEIRDQRLYRATHDNFADYCKERWHTSKTHANRLIQAAGIVERLTPIGVKPDCEAQTRPLAALPPEQQAEVWKAAVATAPEGKVTAEHVAKVVRERQASPDGPVARPQIIYEPRTPPELRVVHVIYQESTPPEPRIVNSVRIVPTAPATEAPGETAAETEHPADNVEALPAGNGAAPILSFPDQREGDTPLQRLRWWWQQAAPGEKVEFRRWLDENP